MPNRRAVRDRVQLLIALFHDQLGIACAKSYWGGIHILMLFDEGL